MISIRHNFITQELLRKIFFKMTFFRDPSAKVSYENYALDLNERATTVTAPSIDTQLGVWVEEKPGSTTGIRGE